jgi:hypothetical protein
MIRLMIRYFILYMHQDNLSIVVVFLLVHMLITVVIKFTAPRIDEIPARCSLKIAKSTDAPPWAILEDKGG